MVVVIAWFLSFFIVSAISQQVDNADVDQTLFLVSRPISNFWNTMMVDVDYDIAAFLVALAALDIVVDIWTLCLPLPVIKNLHMGTRRKFQVVGAFWLGLL